MTHSTWLVVSTVLVLVSCGGEATSKGAAGAGAGGPAGSAGHAGEAGTSGGAGGSAGSEPADTGLGTKPDCTGFDDEPPRNVNVVYENLRSTPIFVTPADTFQPGTRFGLISPAGKQLELFPDVCGFASCEILQQGFPNCDAGLTWVPLIRIDPGGSFTEVWNGLAAIQRTMPANCYPDSGLSSSSQMLEPAPGIYKVVASARTDCAQCTCTPSSSGSCDVPLGFYDAGLAGETLETSVDVALPAVSEIELGFR